MKELIITAKSQEQFANAQEIVSNNFNEDQRNQIAVIDMTTSPKPTIILDQSWCTQSHTLSLPKGVNRLAMQSNNNIAAIEYDDFGVKLFNTPINVFTSLVFE